MFVRALQQRFREAGVKYEGITKQKKNANFICIYYKKVVSLQKI